MHIHCTYLHNSYLTVIRVYSTMHLMHPNYCQISILLVVDLCSLLAYFMMTQPFPIASKLPIKTLVAMQLPTNVHGTIYLHPHEIQCRWFSRSVFYKNVYSSVHIVFFDHAHIFCFVLLCIPPAINACFFLLIPCHHIWMGSY